MHIKMICGNNHKWAHNPFPFPPFHMHTYTAFVYCVFNVWMYEWMYSLINGCMHGCDGNIHKWAPSVPCPVCVSLCHLLCTLIA